MKKPTLLGLALLGVLGWMGIGCGSDNKTPAGNGGAALAGATSSDGGSTSSDSGATSSGGQTTTAGASSVAGAPGTGGAGGNLEQGCGVTVITDFTNTPSANPQEAAAKFLAESGSTLGDFTADLRPVDDGLVGIGWDATTESYEFWQVRYDQWRNGLPVYGGRVDVLVEATDSYPVVLVNSTGLDMADYAPSYHGTTVNDSTTADVLADIESRLDLQHIAAASLGNEDITLGARELVVWAGLKTSCVPPSLAVTFAVLGTSSQFLHAFVVDASDGTILDSNSLVQSGAASGTVTVRRTPATAECLRTPDPSAVPMPFVNVTAISTSGERPTSPADNVGAFTVETTDEVAQIQVGYDGLYAAVSDERCTDLTTTVRASSGGSASIIMNQSANGSAGAAGSAATSACTDPQALTDAANVYTHIHAVRKWAKSYAGSWLALDRKMQATTGYSSQLPSGGLCIDASAESTWSLDCYFLNFCTGWALPDIVYHEYGHQLVYWGWFRRSLNPDSPLSEAYGEGIADAVALFTAPHDAYFICGLPTPRVTNCNFAGLLECSSNCGREAHACGQVLASTLWDIGQALEDRLDPSAARAVVSRLVVSLAKEWAPQLDLGLKDDLPKQLFALDKGQHSEQICVGLEKHSWLSDTMRTKCCPSGQTWNPNAVPPACECPAGTTLDVVTQTCKCEGECLLDIEQDPSRGAFQTAPSVVVTVANQETYSQLRSLVWEEYLGTSSGTERPLSQTDLGSTAAISGWVMHRDRYTSPGLLSVYDATLENYRKSGLGIETYGDKTLVWSRAEYRTVTTLRYTYDLTNMYDTRIPAFKAAATAASLLVKAWLSPSCSGPTTCASIAPFPLTLEVWTGNVLAGNAAISAEALALLPPFELGSDGNPVAEPVVFEIPLDLNAVLWEGETTSMVSLSLRIKDVGTSNILPAVWAEPAGPACDPEYGLSFEFHYVVCSSIGIANRLSADQSSFPWRPLLRLYSAG